MATTYKKEMDAGVAGAIATTENKDIVSRNVETAAGIGFGLAVVQGVNDKGIRLATTGDTKILGVTVLDRTAGDLINGKFQQYESARVMIKGTIWVQVTEDVKAGDDVAVDLATAKFNKAGVKIANARYETSAATGGLAQIHIK